MKKGMATVGILVCLAVAALLLGQKAQEQRAKALRIEQAQQQLERISQKVHEKPYQLRDLYAGAYINEDGDLVVRVTKQYDRNSGIVEEYTGNPQVLMETVDYTHEDLLETLEVIGQRYEELYRDPSLSGLTDEQELEALQALLTSFRASGTDQLELILYVEIYDLTDEKAELFRKCFFDEPYIRLQNTYATYAPT